MNHQWRSRFRFFEKEQVKEEGAVALEVGSFKIGFLTHIPENCYHLQCKWTRQNNFWRYSFLVKS